MSYTNISDKWGAAVEVTADDYRKQAEIFGVEVVIDERAAGIYIDGELVAEAMAMDTSKTPKEYTIKRQSKAGAGYESMVIRNRETGEDIAEYRLTPGAERREIAAMRRSLDKHLATANGTLGNYQW